MDGVQPWMQLKMNADTFVLPEEDGGVYFRNNVGSFRMEGAAIQSWIEKLAPVFDGQTTLESLTDGLPKPYQERIYEIAGILYENGFARDVSRDQTHQLSEDVLHYYSPQIEFVDNLAGSGAARFEVYRNTHVLVVSTGSTVGSVVGSLLESGLQTVNLWVTDHCGIDRERFNSQLAAYQEIDGKVSIRDMSPQTGDTTELTALRNVVKEMDAVVYVGQNGDTEELSRIESICIAEQVLFLPAICVDKVGIVGPCIKPQHSRTKSEWNRAWQRIHRPVFERDLGISAPCETTFAILCNVLVFELFKVVTGVDGGEQNNRFYTLNFETLEGAWHEYIPASEPVLQPWERADAIRERILSDSNVPSPGDLLSAFAQITDTTSGIFHVWEEGDLPQLPLAQCLVQSVDPLSAGPADFLPEVVRAGLTHEDARREAGLAGIEAYVARVVERHPKRCAAVGIGAGSSMVEAVGRGLDHALTRELRQRLQGQTPHVRQIHLREVRDERAAFYLNALQPVGAHPILGLGDDVYGFPVALVGVEGHFVASTGLCVSMAIQRALKLALCVVSTLENTNDGLDDGVLVAAAHVRSEAEPFKIDIETWNGFTRNQAVEAIDRLTQIGKEVTMQDLALGELGTLPLAAVCQVSIVEGETQ